MKEIIGKSFDRLFKKGIDDFSRKDEIIGVIVFILMYLLLFVIIYLIINKWIISVTIIVVMLSMVGFFIKGLYKDDINNNFMLSLGIITIPILFLTMILTLKIVPYRGNNLMLQRKHKLKRITRKTRNNKLKFWK